MRTWMLLALAVIMLLAVGCGDLDSGVDPFQAATEDHPGQFTFKANLTETVAANGDSVFIRGSLTKGFGLTFIGIVEGDSINAPFGTDVGDSWQYTVGLLIKGSDGKSTPVIDDIYANGILLTAIQSTETEFLRVMKIVITDGDIGVDPIRDDTDKIVVLTIRVTGVDPNDPDSEFNEPVSQDKPLKLLTSELWNDPNELRARGVWSGAWYFTTKVLKGANHSYYLRVEKPDGWDIRQGVFVDNVMLTNLHGFGGDWKALIYDYTCTTVGMVTVCGVVNPRPNDNDIHGDVIITVGS